VLRFGTDGVRGDAEADLSTPLVVALGRAMARALGADTPFLIGRDTRESGARIERDLATGLAVEEAGVVLLDVMPTPAIAYLAQVERAPAAVVSASHNPWTDNGVKVIGADGRKLPDDAEARIEHDLRTLAEASLDEGDRRAARAPIALPGAADAYLDHVVGALGGRTLEHVKIVLDCANGAASEVGPRVLRAAGADVVVLHAEPDGRNINAECGSTHPESLQRAVVEHNAAIGLALDGDADRVLAVDESGALVDGDEIMTITALDMHARKLLRNDAIVVTVMSNLGLRRAMQGAGIEVVETPVGDRNVVAAMEARDLAVGGEQSGHIVYADYATTGDGLLTGVLLCDVMVRAAAPLSGLAAQMTRVPQVLENVRLAQRVDLTSAGALWECVHDVESELDQLGRVLVRPSGTEPLVRIMVEAPTHDEAARAAARIRRAVESEFGAS
jgi:phosphoglucosamine mutase